MKTSALSLALAAGLCSTASATTTTGEIPSVPMELRVKSAGMLGHIYYRPATGEMVFTPQKEYMAARRAQLGLRDGANASDINGDTVVDAWVQTNSDPCNLGPTTSPSVNIAGVDIPPTTTGDYHLYKTTIGSTDCVITSIQYQFWTDYVDTDTNADTIPDGNTNGLGFNITFFDREPPFGATTTRCPLERVATASFDITGVPGPLVAPPAGFINGFTLTIDLTGTGTADLTFELADSDGTSTAPTFSPMVAADMFPNCAGCKIDTTQAVAPDGFSDADWDSDTLIDWAYSISGLQATDVPAITGYSLAAPGIYGVPNAGNPTDGIIDWVERLDGTPPAQADQTRIVAASVIPPMAGAYPFLSAVIPGIPSRLSRFSLFLDENGDNPTPSLGVCGAFPAPGGLPNSDFFFWGSVSALTGTFIGGLNCSIDDDGDTVIDGRPLAAAWMALGTVASGPTCVCDVNGDNVLNLDDINFLVVNLPDVNGDTVFNLDDISVFVDCFLNQAAYNCP